MRRRRGLIGALLLGGAFALGACTTGTPEPRATGDAAAEQTSQATTEPSPQASPTSAPDAELPGEAWDSGPTEGAELAVVGVAADDVLNLRTGPGVTFPATGELDPLGTAEATGRNRVVDDGFWVEVMGAGSAGWANYRYLAYLGDVTDITSEIGELPTGELELLALAVADTRTGDAPEDALQVVVVDGPHKGALGEVTVDVLGFADDSVIGSRLHVFAQRTGDLFEVRTVEQTLLCARGVESGLCL